jgi:hypothetical protein
LVLSPPASVSVLPRVLLLGAAPLLLGLLPLPPVSSASIEAPLATRKSFAGRVICPKERGERGHL